MVVVFQPDVDQERGVSYGLAVGILTTLSHACQKIIIPQLDVMFFMTTFTFQERIASSTLSV
jgi:bifunctional DNase/RNase